VNKRESARLRGLDTSRDFWLRMLIPGTFLTLLIVLIGFCQAMSLCKPPRSDSWGFSQVERWDFSEQFADRHGLFTF
jgi:hypothetical protein